MWYFCTSSSNSFNFFFQNLLLPSNFNSYYSDYRYSLIYKLLIILLFSWTYFNVYSSFSSSLSPTVSYFLPIFLIFIYIYIFFLFSLVLWSLFFTTQILCANSSFARNFLFYFCPNNLKLAYLLSEMRHYYPLSICPLLKTPLRHLKY